MANIRYIKTRCNLDSASESLTVGYWTRDPFHITNAREALIRALCGGNRDALEEAMAEAISDTHDLDVTDADYARAVVDALLDYAAPLPATPEVEKAPKVENRIPWTQDGFALGGDA